jgi:phosphoribosylglycinamide formyltransferase-1
VSKRIVLLASGSGSLASAIFQRVPLSNIVGVISDKDAPVLERAREVGVTGHFLPLGGDRNRWNEELFALVESLAPDLVVSVGFMRILEERFVTHFKVINTHPALLPAFPGAHAVRDALAAGVSETGTTVHWVDKGVDTGPVIKQVTIPVLPGDTEDSLHERIKVVERELIVETIYDFLESKVEE